MKRIKLNEESRWVLLPAYLVAVAGVVVAVGLGSSALGTASVGPATPYAAPLVTSTVVTGSAGLGAAPKACIPLTVGACALSGSGGVGELVERQRILNFSVTLTYTPSLNRWGCFSPDLLSGEAMNRTASGCVASLVGADN
jgi:hypothetical protein